jgi:hypothetical protein
MPQQGSIKKVPNDTLYFAIRAIQKCRHAVAAITLLSEKKYMNFILLMQLE